MTSRPIIFSAPMIRALLDGRKTMTRRLAWRYKADVETGDLRWPSPWQLVKPGDRLWVRENWLEFDADHVIDGQRVAFGADTPPGSDGDRIRKDYGYKWRPSIHMPRWASRLTLVVSATKIERLQEISAKDCLAEGIPPITEQSFWNPPIPAEPNLPAIYRGAFACLWAEIHGPDSWDANPEVVALTFRVVRANVDSAEARAA